MLLSSSVGCPPSFLSGFGTTAAEATALAQKSINLKALQTALVALSTASGNPAINPGTPSGGLYDGLPDDKTMAAVAASLALIGPKLGTYTRAALMIGLGVGASTHTAKQAVLDYATELTAAAKAATIAAPYYTTPPAAPSNDLPQIFQTTGPWYKTWWGIAAIAVGVLGTVSLVRAHRQTAA